jgi:hypothetical protein
MTSLIAWIAVDQRVPSAFYMASDSRISWGSEHSRWDAGRKLFLCRRHSDIFGYAGDVVFPSLVLGQITEAADVNLLFQNHDTSEDRHMKFVDATKASFQRRHNAPNFDFFILHGSRQFSGPKAQFRLWCLSFNAATRKWVDSEINVPANKSTCLPHLEAEQNRCSRIASIGKHQPKGGQAAQFSVRFVTRFEATLTDIAAVFLNWWGCITRECPKFLGLFKIINDISMGSPCRMKLTQRLSNGEMSFFSASTEEP